MNNIQRILECETSDELAALEGLYVLSEYEQGLVYKRRIEIVSRLLKWGMENEQHGLTANLSDSWTPEQRRNFLREWNDDGPLMAVMNSEPVIQSGRGEKRSASESGEGTSEQVSDSNYFTVTSVKQVKMKKFRTTGTDYTVRFTNTFANMELSKFLGRLHEIFSGLLSEVVRDVPENDQVRFVLQSPQLDHPISLPFLHASRLTTERILAEIERVVQSNHKFRLNDSVNVNIIHVEMPRGGTGTKRAEINLEKHLISKRSIIQIQNEDDMCLARALVVSISRIENDSRDRQIRNHNRPLQSRLAYDLHEKAGVLIGKCGMSEVKQFQAYLTEYEINIVSKGHQDAIVYTGPVEKGKRIYLYLHDNHYDVITSMPAFFARKRYCHDCKRPYDKSVDHMCPNACQCCRFPDCPIVSWISCTDCNRMFKSRECFDRHKQNIGNERSVCVSLVKCMHCKSVVKRERAGPDMHHCGQSKCGVCKEYVDPKQHQCYMQAVVEKTAPENGELLEDGVHNETSESGYNELLFFDFECQQEDGTHEPNLCVVQNEAGDEWVFEGDNTRNEFCEWLFTKGHEGCIVMAHNFQGYDGYFIQQYLHENGVIPEVIMRGAKILSMYIPMLKIKFIDSLSFIPMRLADFPKTFGLDELVKGYFPHLFNRRENRNYIGPLPPSPYYHPDGMSPSDREKFMKWHGNLVTGNYVFNFQEEILTYCRSDVDILRRCCLEFRELFRDITNSDPFEKCLTIASACNLVFRTNFLKEDTIAILPPHGYHPGTKQSNIALKWLSYTAERNGIYIRHKRNGGEKTVGHYSLDGYDEESRTAYEFHGCFWHGKLFSLFGKGTNHFFSLGLNPVIRKGVLV
jgi:hypothetical protein